MPNWKKWLRFPPEALFWFLALGALASSNPEADVHYTVCPVALMGFEFCPGCGLGRSISAIFHGNLMLSWEFHWFGGPALVIILYRFYILTRKYYQSVWQEQ